MWWVNPSLHALVHQLHITFWLFNRLEDCTAKSGNFNETTYKSMYNHTDHPGFSMGAVNPWRLTTLRTIAKILCSQILWSGTRITSINTNMAFKSSSLLYHYIWCIEKMTFFYWKSLNNSYILKSSNKSPHSLPIFQPKSNYSQFKSWNSYLLPQA